MNAKSRSSGQVRIRTQQSSKKKNAKIALAAAIGAIGWQLLGGSSHNAVAQPIYFWDPLGVGGTGSSESAPWSIAPPTADWSNGGALPDVDWNDNTGTSTIADFALSGDTATISGATVGALGLIFGAGGDVITGTSTLLLGSSGITTAGGTTTISAPVTLVASSTFNVGSTLTITAPISGAGMGFTETNDGTIKLTATNTYTGTTTVNSGTLDLSFGTSGAAMSNILAPTSSLALGGGTLLLDMGAKMTSPTQTFAGTTLTPALSAITITHTVSTGTPGINLGSISAPTPGAALILTGPQTIGAGNAVVNSVGKISVGTVNGDANTASKILIFGFDANNATVAGADWATVGLYDYAGVDSTGTNVESLSQLGLYTTFSGTTNTALTGNADVSGTASTNNGNDTPSSIRFNSSSATNLTINSGASAFVRTGGILVTPNLGANNVTINGTVGTLTARNPGSASATEMIVYQNNTLGFFDINTGIGETTGSDSYTQVGQGTVVLSDAGSAAYIGQTYLDGGFTEIPDNNAIGLASSAATLNLQGGTLIGSTSFSLDNGSSGSGRPIDILAQGGSLAAAGTNTLTADGAITGSGLLTIGAGLVAGTGSGTANNSGQVRGTSGTVILSGGAANTYSGGTLVSTGTLQLDGATSSIGSGPVAVSDTTVVVGTNTTTYDGHLIGSGTIATTVTDQSGGHINPGDAGVGTLSMAALTLKNNAFLDYDFATSPSPSNDLIDVTTANGLVLGTTGTGTVKVNLFQVGTSTAFDTPGTYDLIQINGGTTLTSATVNTDLKMNNPVANATYTFGVDPTNNYITVSIAGLSINAAWDNTGGGNWSDGANDQNGSDPNWVGGIAPGTTGAGDVAMFGPPTSSGGTGINAPSTIDLNTSETVGTINFDNSNSYTISSAEGNVLTLDSGSSGAAAIVDSLGTHTLGQPLSIVLNKNLNITVTNSTDSLVISGAITGTTNININPSSGAGTVIFTDPNANANYSGAITVSSGTAQMGNGGATGGFAELAGTGTVTVNGTLSYDLSSTVTLSDKVTGTGTLAQNGTGILLVSHANNLMSVTNINNGTLQLGNSTALGTSSVNIASPGILDLNGKSPTINTLSGNGTIDDVSAGGSPTLTIGTTGISTNNNTFSGSILDSTGTVSLVQAGTGTLTLNGASTYSGGTDISAGVIKAGNNSAFGTGTITVALNVASGLQLANGVNISNPIIANTGNVANAFEDVPDPGASATLSGPITSNKDVRIGTSQSTSTLVLTGNDTVGISTTGVVLTRGNVVFAANNTFADNGSNNPLIVGRYNTTNPNLNVTIQDNAVVTSNSGLELGGSDGTTDDTQVSFTLTGNGTLNTGPGLVDLNNNSRAVSSVTLNLNGTSTLATSGFELLSSSGDATTVNLNGGAIVANGNDPVGGFFPNLSSTILNGTTLTVQVQAGGGTVNNNGNTITIAEALQDGGGSGSDSMTFIGTGTTTLTGNNTYLGNTNVGNGLNTTLVVSNTSGSATGSGNVILISGVLASGTTGSISGNVVSGLVASHTIAPGGIGTVGSLAIGGLTSTNLTTLNFDLGTGVGEVTNGDLLTLGSGTVSIGSGTLMTFGGSPVAGDDYRLIGDTSSGAVVDAIPLANFSLPSAPAGLTYSLSTSVDSGFIDLVVATSGPANLTWNNTGSATPSDGQTWDINVNNNWNNGSADNTVYTDGANVTFNDTNNSTSNGGTNPNAYNVTLSTPVAPASVIVNNSLGNYTISGAGTIGGTGSLTKSGTGTLILSTPNTYSGGTTVTAGRLLIEPTSPTTSALPTGTLSISGNAIVQLADNVTAGTALGTSNVQITSLSLIGNGTLDIGNNHIIIDYGNGPDPIGSIAQWIYNGFYDLSGPQIISSDIAADDLASGLSYGIGYADGADGIVAGLPSGEIEIMLTLLGDANLDGTVNTEDFTRFSTNLGQSGMVWDDGDFNYDGTVNTEDFTLFSHNLGESDSLAAAAGTLEAAKGISLANVPEPASTGLLTLGLGSLLARRRRKGKAL